jgi:hypothetical protein
MALLETWPSSAESVAFIATQLPMAMAIFHAVDRIDRTTSPTRSSPSRRRFAISGVVAFAARINAFALASLRSGCFSLVVGLLIS